jgi:hypothetical protein
MPPPPIVSSFLSVQPLEPVLVFRSSDEAAYFQSYCKQGRILPEQASKWVFLPMPTGLLRVRKAKDGDIAYDFDGHNNARKFNESIMGLGRMYANSNDNPTFDRSVYLGKK